MRLFLALAALCSSLPAQQIRNLELEPEIARPLQVAYGKGATTVMFPSSIEAFRGGRTINQGKGALTIKDNPNVHFALTYTPGSYYFTLKALRKDASDVLTVIYQGNAYNFLLTADATSPTITANCKVNRAGSRSKSKVIQPARLAGLLDKAKAWHLLKRNHAHSLEGITYSDFGRSKGTNGMITYNDTHLVFIDEGWRFSNEDTVIFKIKLQNLTDRPLIYEPLKFYVRVGSEIYNVNMAEAPGEIPPGFRENINKKDTLTPGPPTTAYISFSGSPTGTRNNISLNNTFTILNPSVAHRNSIVTTNTTTPEPSPTTSSESKS